MYYLEEAESFVFCCWPFISI